MRRSWLGLQLVLSCALLLAVFAVEGRCCKEEERSSEEECHCEKRHHCVEECCEKRCHHHEEEECCCETRCHHEEEECCCEKRCHHEEEECCCEKRCHHEDEECCKKKHSHGKEEPGKKKHSHGKEESGKKKHSHGKEESGKKKHSHGKKESGKKKHSHAEEEKEEADKKKHSHVGEKQPKKRRPLLEELKKANPDSSERYNNFAKEEQQRIASLAAQTSDAVSQHRKDAAIAHANQGNEGIFYKHLEDGQMEYKKAIGVMVYVNMLLGNTNCTKTKEQEEAGVEYSRAYLEKEGCQFLPQLKQVKFNCTFGIFIDMRTEKKAIINKVCTIIPGIKQLFKPLKGRNF